MITRPGPAGWASALQTNFPMGETNCRQPTRYDGRRRSPLTVSRRIKSPKNHNAVLHATADEPPHKSVIHWAKRVSNINNERGGTNTQDSNAINDTGKMTCRTRTINIEAANASANDTATQTRHRRARKGKHATEKRDEPTNAHRMQTSPTPPPRMYRQERPRSPPYRSERPPSRATRAARKATTRTIHGAKT